MTFLLWQNGVTLTQGNPMLQLRSLSLVLISLVFVGCATQRPQMTEEMYSSFGKGWALLHHCSAEGLLDASDAARGRTYMVATMNNYLFEGSRIDAEAYQHIQSNSKPSIQDCRNLNVSIQGRRQQIENHNAQTAMQQQEAQSMINATKSTQTYCNRIGTQVLCNSF